MYLLCCIQLSDTEQRLTTLQCDYKLLQDSYDQLETTKDCMTREHEIETKRLRMKCGDVEEELARVQDTSNGFESIVCSMREKVDSLQSALNQSEFELAESERICQVSGQN